MTSLASIKIKKFFKRIFPFVKYRWEIYAALKKSSFYTVFKKSPRLSFAKFRRFIYYKELGDVGLTDLSQKIFFTKKSKLEFQPLNESNRSVVRKYADKYLSGDVHSNRIRQHYINTYNGFIAAIEGEIIGHYWWWANDQSTPPPIELIFFNIKLEKGDVYGFDFYIAPPYRGSGNALEFLTNLYFVELKKLGYSRVTGVEDPKNLAANWVYKIFNSKYMRTISIHVFFNTVIYCDKAIFLKKWYQYHHPCTSRMLLSFRSIFKCNK